MFSETNAIVIPDNSINVNCMILLFIILLLIMLVVYVVSLELNKQRIAELKKFKKELMSMNRKR